MITRRHVLLAFMGGLLVGTVGLLGASAVLAQRGEVGLRLTTSQDHAMQGAMTIEANAHHGTSPYAGQFTTADAIRALNQDEVAQIRAGEGAGLAKTAELNGVPGPRHVLDLAADLGLSADQVAKIQPIYDEMRAKAVGAGAAYLAAQEALETDFRSGRLMSDALRTRVGDVARLRAELEGAHLAAHLATAAVLSADQTAHYNTLRGY